MDLRSVNTRLSLSFMSLLVLALLISRTLPSKTEVLLGVTTPNQKLAYALVSVDINPSFELYTDLNDLVIDVVALNAEAQAMDSTLWVGKDVQWVVSDLIAQASSLGYLDITDLNQDYIVVSTVSFGADGTRLVKDLKFTLESNLDLNRTVSTYVLEASEKDYEDANSEHVSLGLFMMNGWIQNNGTPMSVQEFVSNPNNLELLEENAEHASSAELKSVIQALIDDLKSQGIDTTSYQTRMNNTSEDLEELVEDIKDVYRGTVEDSSNDSDSNEDDSKSNDSNSNDSSSIDSNDDDSNSDDSNDDDSHLGETTSEETSTDHATQED